MRPAGTPPRHAVGLYRVSTAEQGNSGLGLEAQQASVRAFAAAQGWTLVAELSDIAGQAVDMPAADDLMMRIYAAMAQKERELISERTRAALAAARARGRALGGDRGYRPTCGPDAQAAQARQEAAERTAHRLVLEVEALRAEGITTHQGLARSLTERGVPTPRGGPSGRTPRSRGRSGAWGRQAAARPSRSTRSV
jgi:DNA invertase Pin-like site-specific DNA recombinase